MFSNRPAAASQTTAIREDAALWAQPAAGADREQIILRYVPLVHSIVGRLGLRGGNEYDDMVSQGMLGLINAVDRFDPARGICFSTFASRHIEGRVRDGLRALDLLSRTARHRVRQVEAAEDRLHTRLGRTPVEAEVAASTGLDARQVRRARTDAAHTSLSLDAAAQDEELYDAVADETEDPLTTLIDRDLRARLLESLSSLAEREHAILTLRYSEGLSLKEIAARMNLSDARVCQLHARAVSTLRAQLQDDVQSLAH